jgi:hypothetical protein
MSTLLRLLAVSAISLSACSTPIDAPMSTTFGEAVATLDKQIIPPPVPNDAPPESSATRGVLAVHRYERGEPRRPDTYSTSAVSSMAVTSGAGPAGVP